MYYCTMHTHTHTACTVHMHAVHYSGPSVYMLSTDHGNGLGRFLVEMGGSGKRERERERERERDLCKSYVLDMTWGYSQEWVWGL